MLDTSIALEKAKSGRLSVSEYNEVVALLRSPNGRDKYTLLHILGRSNVVPDRELVEPYLDFALDPMVASMALKVLCDYWCLTEEYLDKLTQFVSGVGWDFDEDVRLVAISILGEFLRRKMDADYLKLLYYIYKDDNVFHVTRAAAYDAMARAMGREWSELSSVSGSIEFKKNADEGLIGEVVLLLNR